MNPMDWFAGYRTYAVSALMVLSGVTELVGVDVPWVEAADAGRWITEGLAFMFLRKGVKEAMQ